MNRLPTQPGQVRTHQQGGATGLRMEGGHMTEVTTCLIEQLFTRLHVVIVHITTRRHSQPLHIEVHVLHVFRRHVEVLIAEPHHRTFLHLQLSLADLLGVTAVGHTHITGETEFHRQVGMLCLVTRQAELQLTPFVDIVTPSADAPLGIVALSGQRLDLIGIERHHLSHTDMAQRHTDRTEQVVGTDGVGIPFGD